MAIRQCELASSQHQRPTHCLLAGPKEDNSGLFLSFICLLCTSVPLTASLRALAVDRQETRATLMQRRQMKDRKRPELSSLLNKLIRSNSTDNTNQVKTYNKIQTPPYTQ